MRNDSRIYRQMVGADFVYCSLFSYSDPCMERASRLLSSDISKSLSQNA